MSFVSGNVLAGEDMNKEFVHYLLRRLGFLSCGALPEVFHFLSGIVSNVGEDG